MRDYELVMLVSPDVGDEGFPGTVERVSKFIQERGGEVKDVDQWGRRRLAYPIRRFSEGFYAVTRFSLEPNDVRALEGNLDLAEDVLRHLVVRQDEVRETAQEVRETAQEVRGTAQEVRETAQEVRETAQKEQ